MFLIKSSLSHKIFRIFEQVQDWVLGQKLTNCPEFQKRFYKKNGTCIAYIAYACKRRI